MFEEFKTYRRIIDEAQEALIRQVATLAGLAVADVKALLGYYPRLNAEAAVKALQEIADQWAKEKDAEDEADQEAREYNRAGLVLPPRGPVGLLASTRQVSRRVIQPASSYG